MEFTKKGTLNRQQATEKTCIYARLKSSQKGKFVLAGVAQKNKASTAVHPMFLSVGNT